MVNTLVVTVEVHIKSGDKPPLLFVVQIGNLCVYAKPKIFQVTKF